MTKNELTKTIEALLTVRGKMAESELKSTISGEEWQCENRIAAEKKIYNIFIEILNKELDTNLKTA